MHKKPLFWGVGGGGGAGLSPRKSHKWAQTSILNWLSIFFLDWNPLPPPSPPYSVEDLYTKIFMQTIFCGVVISHFAYLVNQTGFSIRYQIEYIHANTVINK